VWHGDDLRMRLSGAAVHRGDDALHVSGRQRIDEIGTDGGDDLIRTCSASPAAIPANAIAVPMRAALSSKSTMKNVGSLLARTASI